MATHPIQAWATIATIPAWSAPWPVTSSFRGAIALSGRSSDGAGTYHGLRRKHVDTYLNEFVFRYNRRFYRHASFETLLGLASNHVPTTYWDIINRENPRKPSAKALPPAYHI